MQVAEGWHWQLACQWGQPDNHDKTGVPVLLAGQPSLHRKLLQGRGDDHVGAMLYSRIGIIRDLEARCKGQPGEPLYSVGDIRLDNSNAHRRDHSTPAPSPPCSFFCNSDHYFL